MDDAYCLDCKKATDVVTDLSVGDTACMECGLIIDFQSIEETSEWRIFANESNHSNPVPVGKSTNPLLADGGLPMVIAKPNRVTSDFLSTSLGSWQNHEVANPDQTLIHAFKTIDTMANKLGLVSLIKDRANEIYQKYEVRKSRSGKRNEDAIMAACLYIACRQEEKPHTIKEIYSVANGATMKEVKRAKTYIVKQLELEMGTIHAVDFMRRFCSNIGMNNQAAKVAHDAVNILETFDIKAPTHNKHRSARRSPMSVAAAVIYITTQLSDDKKALKDVSLATGVAESTIKNAYKDLYPYISKIIPIWYAKEEDLKNLSIS